MASWGIPCVDQACHKRFERFEIELALGSMLTEFDRLGCLKYGAGIEQARMAIEFNAFRDVRSSVLSISTCCSSQR